MAKKARSAEEVNKAQLIRDAFNKIGIDAPAKEIQAYTKAHGGEVAPAQVSNIRTKLKEQAGGGSAKGRKGKAAASGGGVLTGEALLQVRNFAEKIGGLERTKELIGILEKLR